MKGVGLEAWTTMLEPGSWYQNLGAKFLLGTKILVIEEKLLILTTWYQDLGAQIWVSSSCWVPRPEKEVLVIRFFGTDPSTWI